MKKLFFIGMLAILTAGCQKHNESENNQQEHDHEDVKKIITSYSDDLELFAKADPFVVGKSSNILAHFSRLPDFSALEEGSITVRLRVIGKEMTQTIENPKTKGIYSFDIVPEKEGFGTLFFDIKSKDKEYNIIIKNIQVYNDDHDAIHDAENENSKYSTTNVFPFTKEQSWKIDFASEYPRSEPFGEVIKTSAQVQSAQGDEIIISAKTSGITVFPEEFILEGKPVKKGQNLFSVSGSSMADNNISVKFSEAKNNFERSSADYERSKELAKDNIISDKKLSAAKNDYENAKSLYYNLSKNFSSFGQNVKSPMTGFVRHIHVKNGEFVRAGQAIVSISQNKTLLLHADVQQKYASVLQFINTANIRTLHNNKTYSLDELNGKILSFGKHTNDDNYLLPVSLQIDNIGDFVSGGFVELYLKTTSKNNVLTIPNEALVEDQGIFYVFVQITAELFEKREVKLGATDGIKTEIINGIKKEERIITKGAVFIKLSEATGGLDAHSGHVH